MPAPVAMMLAVAYLSLAVELTLLRVPSVASSLAIWSADPDRPASYSPRYRRLFALGKPSKLLLLAPPLGIVYGVYLYPVLVLLAGPDPFGDYLFAPTPLAYSAAIALMFGGRALALAAVLTIRRRNEQKGESFYLHTTGVFRYCRNPGLMGMYLLCGGIWLAMPSALLLSGIAIYVIYMHFKVRMEEDFLGNKFGRPYLEYRLRTGRYFP